MASDVYIKHAKISQSQPSSCFREKNDTFKVGFFNSLIRLIRNQRQVKISSLEESGRIVAHENVHFSTGNYETRSSKLAEENAKC